MKYEVTDIPAEAGARQAALAELIDAVSNKDDEIAELVIERSRSTPGGAQAAIRRLTCKMEMVPVLCGSAFKKRGVQPLVDAVIDYLPSPLDVPPARARCRDGGPSTVPTDDTASSVRWPSSSGPIPMWASWCSSAFTAASSRRATPSTIRAPANASGSAGS
jgi:translation elongation factor EF-G